MTKNKVFRTMSYGGLLICLILGAGCDSVNPGDFFSKNACNIFNCNVLFFVEDVFPLSAGPMVTEGEGGAAEAEEEGGGHGM